MNTRVCLMSIPEVLHVSRIYSEFFEKIITSECLLFLSKQIRWVSGLLVCQNVFFSPVTTYLLYKPGGQNRCSVCTHPLNEYNNNTNPWNLCPVMCATKISLYTSPVWVNFKKNLTIPSTWSHRGQVYVHRMGWTNYKLIDMLNLIKLW